MVKVFNVFIFESVVYPISLEYRRLQENYPFEMGYYGSDNTGVFNTPKNKVLLCLERMNAVSKPVSQLEQDPRTESALCEMFYKTE